MYRGTGESGAPVGRGDTKHARTFTRTLHLDLEAAWLCRIEVGADGGHVGDVFEVVRDPEMRYRPGDLSRPNRNCSVIDGPRIGI